MKNSLIVLILLFFNLSLGAVNAVADQGQGQGQTTRDAIVTACEDKAAGTLVTVNGKEYPCPAPNK